MTARGCNDGNGNGKDGRAVMAAMTAVTAGMTE